MDKELLLERLERLAIVLDELRLAIALDELMPQCAESVRNAIALLKEQEELINKKQKDIDRLCLEVSEWKHKFHDRPLKEQEPVRCKNCAYALFKEGLVQDWHIVCTKPFTERWQTEKPSDWFCADWKRK